MIDTIRKNPALLSGLFVALVNFIVSVGVHVSETQVAAGNALLVSVLALIIHGASVPVAALKELSQPTP